MAMLMLNDVFAAHVGRPGRRRRRTTEYWTEVIGAVRAVHPDFVFAAEAYWDLEWELQQLGFDYCYDKRLYDRLIHDGPDAMRGHLDADLDYQRRLVRFLENHDEPRAATEFAPAQERAAAVVIATLPGRDACGTRASSKAGGCASRCSSAGGPSSRSTRNSARFHLELHRAPPARCDAATGRCATPAAGRTTPATTQLLAWSWIDDEQRSLIVINFADAPAAARIHPPWNDLADGRGGSKTFCRARCSNATGPRSRPTGCTSSWRRGSSTSSHGTTAPDVNA